MTYFRELKCHQKASSLDLLFLLLSVWFQSSSVGSITAGKPTFISFWLGNVSSVPCPCLNPSTGEHMYSPIILDPNPMFLELKDASWHYYVIDLLQGGKTMQ